MSSAEQPEDNAAPPPWAAGTVETSWPNVFAIGDVRAASLKRVASAVGEGAAVVSLLHQALAATTPRPE